MVRAEWYVQHIIFESGVPEWYINIRLRETMPIVISRVDFPLFGFVLQPVWSKKHVSGELWRISCQRRRGKNT